MTTNAKQFEQIVRNAVQESGLMDADDLDLWLEELKQFAVLVHQELAAKGEPVLHVTEEMARDYELSYELEGKPLYAAPQSQAPDKYCITVEDGSCVSNDPRCMHNTAPQAAPDVKKLFTEIRELVDSIEDDGNHSTIMDIFMEIGCLCDKGMRL